MGGDAFPDTVRLTESEYKRICELIMSKIHNSGMNGIRIGFPVEVQDKEDLCHKMGKGSPYGDVDFMVGVDDESKKAEIIALLKAALGVISEASTKNQRNVPC